MTKEELMDFCVSNRMRMRLVGKVGTGKTTIANKLAEKHGLEIRTYSMTRETPVSDLIGFVKYDTGEVSRTKLRDAAENGGIILLEEVDAADPNVIIALNTTENGYIDFADKRVELHKDFMIIETSNTFEDGDYHAGKSEPDLSVTDRSQVIVIDDEPYVSTKTKNIKKVLNSILKDNSIRKEISNRTYYRLDRLLESFEITKDVIKLVLLSNFSSFDSDKILSDHRIEEEIINEYNSEVRTKLEEEKHRREEEQEARRKEEEKKAKKDDEYGEAEPNYDAKKDDSEDDSDYDDDEIEFDIY